MKSFQAQTHYELLEVSVTASAADIRNAYERLVRLYADEQVALYGLIDEDQANGLRAKLKEAHDTLADDARREVYDTSIGLPPREVKVVPRPSVPRQVEPVASSGERAGSTASFAWGGSFSYVTAQPVAAAPAVANVYLVPQPTAPVWGKQAPVVAVTSSEVVASAPATPGVIAASPAVHDGVAAVATGLATNAPVVVVNGEKSSAVTPPVAVGVSATVSGAVASSAAGATPVDSLPEVSASAPTVNSETASAPTPVAAAQSAAMNGEVTAVAPGAAPGAPTATARPEVVPPPGLPAPFVSGSEVIGAHATPVVSASEVSAPTPTVNGDGAAPVAAAPPAAANGVVVSAPAATAISAPEVSASTATVNSEGAATSNSVVASAPVVSAPDVGASVNSEGAALGASALPATANSVVAPVATPVVSAPAVGASTTVEGAATVAAAPPATANNATAPAPIVLAGEGASPGAGAPAATPVASEPEVGASTPTEISEGAAPPATANSVVASLPAATPVVSAPEVGTSTPTVNVAAATPVTTNVVAAPAPSATPTVNTELATPFSAASSAPTNSAVAMASTTVSGEVAPSPGVPAAVGAAPAANGAGATSAVSTTTPAHEARAFENAPNSATLAASSVGGLASALSGSGRFPTVPPERVSDKVAALATSDDISRFAAEESAIVAVRAVPAREFRTEQKSRPYEVPPGVEFNGDLLRQVRMARGVSLLQVSERTRIGVKHLENLEADRYDQLPATVYLRGILMNLARELGLDGLRVSKSYLAFVEAHRSKD